MQIEIPYTSIRMTKRHTDNTKCWWGHGQTESVMFVVGTGIDTLENKLVVSKKLNRTIQSDSAIPLLGIQIRGMNTYVHKKTCTQMPTAELFIIAQNMKIIPMSTHNWMGHIRIMEYHLARK